MKSNSNDKLVTEKMYTGLCTTVASLFLSFYSIRKSGKPDKVKFADKKCSNLRPCTLYYITVTLRYTDLGKKPCRYTVFWKKNPFST